MSPADEQPTRSVGWRPTWLRQRAHDEDLARWRERVASHAVAAANAQGGASGSRSFDATNRQQDIDLDSSEEVSTYSSIGEVANHAIQQSRLSEVDESLDEQTRNLLAQELLLSADVTRTSAQPPPEQATTRPARTPVPSRIDTVPDKVPPLVDFGSVRLPIPEDAPFSVNPTADGRLKAIHIELPGGKLSLSALAAPRFGEPLWPELAVEIRKSINDRSTLAELVMGEWGPEVHASTRTTTSVFLGRDGDRWMLYGVATGPLQNMQRLTNTLRSIMRETVVVRSETPYPIRTVLPLSEPRGSVEKSGSAESPFQQAPEAVPTRDASTPASNSDVEHASQNLAATEFAALSGESSGSIFSEEVYAEQNSMELPLINWSGALMLLELASASSDRNIHQIFIDFVEFLRDLLSPDDSEASLDPADAVRVLTVYSEAISFIVNKHSTKASQSPRFTSAEDEIPKLENVRLRRSVIRAVASAASHIQSILISTAKAPLDQPDRETSQPPSSSDYARSGRGAHRRAI